MMTIQIGLHLYFLRCLLNEQNAERSKLECSWARPPCHCFAPDQCCASSVPPSCFVVHLQKNEQAMNIREIAELSRVSTSTVSRVVNHIPTVNRRLEAGLEAAATWLFSQRPSAWLVSGKPASRTRRFPYEWSLSPEIIQSFELMQVSAAMKSW